MATNFKNRSPGKILQAIRCKLGYNQAEFGAFFGYSRSRMCYYEKDRGSPSFKTIRHIVDTLATRNIRVRYEDLMSVKNREKITTIVDYDGDAYHDVY